MKLKMAPRTDLKPGDTKVIKHFAWMPTVVNGNIVWLEYYQVLKAYIGTTYTVIIDGKPVNFIISKWMTLSKRIISG